MDAHRASLNNPSTLTLNQEEQFVFTLVITSK